MPDCLLVIRAVFSLIPIPVAKLGSLTLPEEAGWILRAWGLGLPKEGCSVEGHTGMIPKWTMAEPSPPHLFSTLLTDLSTSSPVLVV